MTIRASYSDTTSFLMRFRDAACLRPLIRPAALHGLGRLGLALAVLVGLHSATLAQEPATAESGPAEDVADVGAAAGIPSALDRLAPNALSEAIRTLELNLEQEKLQMIAKPSLENRLKLARAREWLLLAQQFRLRQQPVQSSLDVHNSLDLHVHVRFVEPKLYVSLTPILRGNRRSTSVPTVQLPSPVEGWCIDDQGEVAATGLKLMVYCSGDLMFLREGTVPSDVLNNADDEPFPTVVTSQGVSLVFVPDRKTPRYRELKKQHTELESARRQRRALETLAAETQAPEADGNAASSN